MIKYPERLKQGDYVLFIAVQTQIAQVVGTRDEENKKLISVKILVDKVKSRIGEVRELKASRFYDQFYEGPYTQRKVISYIFENWG